jgi:putative DNA primase/helicase
VLGATGFYRGVGALWLDAPTLRFAAVRGRRGARFVSTSEIDKGRRLAESKVKQLTGSDTISARFLFSEPFNFRPEFKLWISTNNKPEIKGTDNAIWDRIRLIPFEVRFEGKAVDRDLPHKLAEEASGMLAWIVRGCLEWQENGLDEPQTVKDATQAYRAEMDAVAGFLEDQCVVAEGKSAPASQLYEAYKFWCEDNGEKPESQRRFGESLKAHGFESFKYTSGDYKDKKGWRGLELEEE